MKLFQDKNRGERGAKCTNQLSVNFDQQQWIKILSLSNEWDVSISNVIRRALRRALMTEKPDRSYKKRVLITKKEREALKSEANNRNMCVSSLVRKAITEI